MMIARADGSGKKRLILGLSVGNLRKLEEGKPMRLRPETHPGIPEGLEIVILYGLTEQTMKCEMEQAGLIGPETKVTVDPRLGPG